MDSLGFALLIAVVVVCIVLPMGMSMVWLFRTSRERKRQWKSWTEIPHGDYVIADDEALFLKTARDIGPTTLDVLATLIRSTPRRIREIDEHLQELGLVFCGFGYLEREPLLYLTDEGFRVAHSLATERYLSDPADRVIVVPNEDADVSDISLEELSEKLDQLIEGLPNTT